MWACLDPLHAHLFGSTCHRARTHTHRRALVCYGGIVCALMSNLNVNIHTHTVNVPVMLQFNSSPCLYSTSQLICLSGGEWHHDFNGC